MPEMRTPSEKLPLLIAGRIHEFEEDEVLQVGKRYLPLLASIGAKAEHGQWLAASNDLNRSDGVECVTMRLPVRIGTGLAIGPAASSPPP
jgi:hypothetical protein